MKKIILALCLMGCCTFAALAQSSAEKGKISWETEFGAGLVFGDSNLSSYGVNYRGEYKSGFSSNVKIAYRFKNSRLLGIKYNIFTATGDYSIENNPVADNLKIEYIGPQIGYRGQVSPKWHLDMMTGLGYMRYKSVSQLAGVERKATKGFWGGNYDMSLSRQIRNGFYLGFSASFMDGRTSSLKVKTGGKSEKVKLDGWNKIKIWRADFMVTIKAIV